MVFQVGALVRVWTNIGTRKPVPLLAKIVEENGVIFTIKYLSESADKVWRYEDDAYEIDTDSIAENLKTTDEQDLGYRAHEDGFIKIDSDSDYVPSDEDEETDDEEDLESDEEEDDEDSLSDEDDIESDEDEDEDEDE